MANKRKRRSKATRSTSNLRMQKSRTNQSDEKRKAETEKSKSQMKKTRTEASEQKRNDQKKKNAIKRKKKRDSQTEEEKEAVKRKDRERKAKKEEAKERELKKKEMEEESDEEEWLDEEDDEELLSDETIRKATAEALKYLHQTHINGTNLHQANVCLVCDCFIIGTEPVKRLNKKRLSLHKERLGVENYQKFYKLKELPEDLRNYYKVEDYPAMLLSPRANLNDSGYSCCATCDNSMNKRDRKKKPPKLSIANGFVIGEFSKIEYTDDNGKSCVFNAEDSSQLTEVMRALLAPTRTHGYVMAFTGGKHRSIMGHYQFFEMDQTKLGGAINHIRHNEKCQHVFCMLSGRMTPQQKYLSKERCKVDTSLYTALSTWFIEKSGHRGFAKVPIPEQCPQPVIIMDEDTTNNLDESASKEVEESFGGGSYHFSSVQDPNPDNSVYENGEKFTMAMLKNANPTLLVYGGKYANTAEIELENLLPFAFPYGVGTPKQKRPNHVSFQACIQRYMRVAMLQFMRGDVVLVMNHIYGRQVSYQSGVMTSRSKVGGESLGEQFSKIPVEELQAAADENDPQSSPMVKTLMKSIFTSCKALGHTPEAAQFARRCCFSMQDYYGLNSVFLTITPDDECNFRIKLLTRPGEEVS